MLMLTWRQAAAWRVQDYSVDWREIPEPGAVPSLKRAMKRGGVGLTNQICFGSLHWIIAASLTSCRVPAESALVAGERDASLIERLRASEVNMPYRSGKRSLLVAHGYHRIDFRGPAHRKGARKECDQSEDQSNSHERQWVGRLDSRKQCAR
jgi:hypothetical protein